jgi:hypothetical protein
MAVSSSSHYRCLYAYSYFLSGFAAYPRPLVVCQRSSIDEFESRITHLIGGSL